MFRITFVDMVIGLTIISLFISVASLVSEEMNTQAITVTSEDWVEMDRHRHGWCKVHPGSQANLEKGEKKGKFALNYATPFRTEAERITAKGCKGIIYVPASTVEKWKQQKK